jgi:hypothetical protein
MYSVQKANTFTKVFFTIKMLYDFTMSGGAVITSTFTEGYGLPYHDFHKAHKYLTPFHADRFYRISPKSDNKCG